MMKHFSETDYGVFHIVYPSPCNNFDYICYSLLKQFVSPLIAGCRRIKESDKFAFHLSPVSFCFDLTMA
jgi:hypothetical protein